MIDALASEAHHADHVRPVLAALPDELRGELIVDADERIERGDRSEGPILVASYGDLKRARLLGRSTIAYIEHGAGQSYGGEPHDPAPPGRKRCAHCHPAYAGGIDHDDVGLTLVPNDQAGERWSAAYPAMDVRVVGCPKLDEIPARDPGDGPVVAMSFHMNAYIGSPEADSAWRYYRVAIPTLARRFNLLGHAHPRYAAQLRPWFRRWGVPFEERFVDVCRKADLYLVDNSSTLFEFASTGRPVIAMNSPAYRPSVRHGLRFWDAAHVGLNVWRAEELPAAIEQALEDPSELQEAREDALTIAYAHRSGAAERAATALVEWMGAEAVAA